MSQLRGENSIIINAPASNIWTVLEDTSLLPEWCTMVKSTTGTRESVGAVRTCSVEFDGRPDEVVERCIEATPNERISWVMEQGYLTKLYSYIQFGFTFEPSGGKTKLTSFGIYEPRNFIGQLIYKLLMGRKMSSVRQIFLINIKRLAEKGTVTTSSSVG